MSKSFRKLFIITCLCGSAPIAWGASGQRIEFDTQTEAITWKSETTQAAAKAANWSVAMDSTAPSPRRVLTIQRINDPARNVFNLYWTRDIAFENGTLAVNIRANSGTIDQGGGMIWRARDARNYYLARYNPLENNLRVYVVAVGARRQLASAEGITIPAGRWWQLQIAHTGSQITAWLNGTKRLQVTDDSIQGPGGVGLWTKADAASSFDDLIINRFRSVPTARQ